MRLRIQSLRNSLRQCPRCNYRYLSSTREQPIGARQEIERKQADFENKYRDQLQRVAKQKGVDLDQLKESIRSKSKLPLNPAKSVNVADKLPHLPTSALPKARSGSGPSIPSLSTIMNLSKLLTRDPPITAGEITTLWQSYHSASTSTTRLGAVIPIKQYHKMAGVAKSNPEFVVALPRQADDGSQGIETIFLQWAFFPDAAGLIDTSTVLFTSLASYKMHGSFAQPALILTHYTDLAQSHGVVLLRGEITTSDKGTPSMTPADAQLLCLRIQQYYGSDPGTDRRATLEDFQKGHLDMDALVRKAWEV